MKKNLIILNVRYLDYEGKNITIGGVQTYISNLAQVAFELDMTVEVYQYGYHNFETTYNGISVYGVQSSEKRIVRDKGRALYNACKKNYDSKRDILLFGIDTLVVRDKIPFALAIQHGIGWDNLNEEPCSELKNNVYILCQAIHAIQRARIAAGVKKMICVDYNYVNWYRTQVLHHDMNYQVIPNFTDIPACNFQKQEEQLVKIIFARRLVPYRGTRIFAAAIEKLLDQHKNIEITFAGDGPDESMLRQRFAKYSNVKFITYSGSESLDVHRDKQIAVVPTVHAEGTSLSLLEAMASSCAVVCSNVGGLSNIVIDNYNGLIINPEAEAVYTALNRLIRDSKLRRCLAERAYDTAKNGFSIENWKEKWKKVLTEC